MFFTNDQNIAKDLDNLNSTFSFIEAEKASGYPKHFAVENVLKEKNLLSMSHTNCVFFYGLLFTPTAL